MGIYRRALVQGLETASRLRERSAARPRGDRTARLRVALQSGLEAAHLRGTPVTDELLRAAVHWPKLRYIDVSDTAVSESGVAQFSEKRPKVRVSAKAKQGASPPN